MSVHVSENLFERNHFDGARVNLIETALDLVAPGRFDFGGRDALIFDQEEFREPLPFVWRELPSFVEESLRVWTRGEIVARNAIRAPLTSAPRTV